MDRERVRESRSLQVYPSLTLESGRQPYLNFKTQFYKTRAMTQCRLASNITGKIIIGNKRFSYNPNGNCEICYRPGLASLYHFLVECPMLSKATTSLFVQPDNSVESMMRALNLLNAKNKKSVNNLYKFLVCCVEYAETQQCNMST